MYGSYKQGYLDVQEKALREDSYLANESEK
jgi:hypothetical protein